MHQGNMLRRGLCDYSGYFSMHMYFSGRLDEAGESSLHMSVFAFSLNSNIYYGLTIYFMGILC